MTFYFPYGKSRFKILMEAKFQYCWGRRGVLGLVGPLGEWPCVRAAQKKFILSRVRGVKKMYINSTFSKPELLLWL